MPPRTAAASTIHGNPTSKTKIPTKASAAIAHSTPFFSARAPIRHAANSTTATTAGLMP